MRLGLVLLDAVLLATLTTSACAPAPYWKEPVGVSDKAEAASDQSVDLDDGGNNYACSHSPRLLEGKPCAPEGAVCGQPSSDPHQLSSTLVCRNGAWDREESPAAPAPTSSAKPAASGSAKP
ncbi:MAG: hypothetical protein ABI183_18355 [Polyangiaceae bacterium]